MDRLTERERNLLRRLHTAWDQAYAKKEYKLSDKLRYKLMKWDRDILKYRNWHPHFEDIEHHKIRVHLRELNGEEI